MPDLRERFHELDRIDAPDLWPDARRRRPGPMRPNGRWRRPLAAALALAVAAAGFVVLVWTFSSPRSDRAANLAGSERGSILLVRGRAIVGPIRDDEIYSMAPDGSAITKLTDAAADGMIASTPAWSPDGGRIAFVLSPPELAERSSDAGIYVMNADGSEVTRITDGRYDEHPTWSPDGSSIAFTRDQGSSLMIVDTVGGDVHSIRIDGDAFPPYQWPAWSPDGARIAFQASQGPHVETNSVYVADIDGSNAERMTPGRADGYPAWFPDGSTIAYAGPDGIHLHDVESGSDRRLTVCRPSVCGFDFAPAWSPDGSELIFSRQDAGGTSVQLFRVNVDGSGPHQLTNGPLWSSEASWRPTLHAVPSETATPPAEKGVFLPPFLQDGRGWETRASSPSPAGDAGVAWASTTPLKDWPRAGQPAIPIDTISSMPSDGIIVTAETTPWVFDPSQGPFPYGEVKLDLSTATLRGPEAEEPPGTYGVLEIGSDAVLVRVYFGTPTPGSELIAAAQHELDTLELPPVCPVPAKGPSGASISATSGSPAMSVTISGPVPLQHEDGSYARRPGRFVAWWNADPSDWEHLASFSSATPSPAISGSDLIRIGEDGANECDFSISFMVPDVPPGDYPIVVIHESGGGATREAVLRFTVD
jgi:Tol biopolymer transport system component